MIEVINDITGKNFLWIGGIGVLNYHLVNWAINAVWGLLLIERVRGTRGGKLARWRGETN